MALRLRVISDHRQRLGDKSTFVFGVSGGSIGRSAENDWVLPDDMRYVSGRHARIVFHNGRYLLQDTSSNGTYVNDIEKPLGSKNPHELKSGDILRIGEYHVQVQIDSATDFSLDDSALYRKGPGSTGNRRRTPPSDLGASLRLENLLEASNDISSDELKPVNAFGQAVSSRTRALHQTQDLPKEASTAPELDVDSEAVARRIARLAKAATKQQQAKQQTAPVTAPLPVPAPLVPAPSPSSYENTPGLQAFCRGAGIGAETLPVDAHARMLHLAGQLLRESLLGLKESNRSQQEQRNSLRVTYEKDRTGMLPSLERHSVEELIQELLKAHDSRRFDAVQWLRDFVRRRAAARRRRAARHVRGFHRLHRPARPARSRHAFRTQLAPQDHGQLGTVRRVLSQPVRNPAWHAAAHLRRDLRAELRPGSARNRRRFRALQRRRLSV